VRRRQTSTDDDPAHGALTIGTRGSELGFDFHNFTKT